MSKVRKLTPKQEDRRHRILSAAREMVADHGYEGMVMSQVADRAEVSPTTLYNLYNTKDQLIMESLKELMRDSALNVLSASEGPGWRFLYQTFTGGAEMANRSPAYADASLQALMRANPGDELVEILLEQSVDSMRPSLAKMADRGELADGVDIELLATGLTGVYWSTFILWNKGVIGLPQLGPLLERNFLSMMIGSTFGEVREQLEQLYAELG